MPLDPWGQAYVVKVPGLNGQSFSILSYGADGREGGDGLNADIVQ
jgi:general secretion pathway protein G